MIKKILVSETIYFYTIFEIYHCRRRGFCRRFAFLYLFTNDLKIYYLISAGMSFVLGLIVNYFLSKLGYLTEQASITNLLNLAFFAIGVVGLIINELFI